MDDREKRKARIYRIIHLVITVLVILICLWQCCLEERRVQSGAVPVPAAPPERTSPAPGHPYPVQAPEAPPAPNAAPVPEPPAAQARPEIPPSTVPEGPAEPPEKAAPEEAEALSAAPREAPSRIPAPPTLLDYYYEDKVDWGAQSLQVEDFFKDFFVSGSDVVYPDGPQNPQLYINDEFYGSIKVDMRDNKPYLDSAELRNVLAPILEKGFSEELFSARDAFLSQEYLTGKGVRNSFDPNSFEVRLFFDPSQLPEQSISLSYSQMNLLKADNIEGLEEIEPANFSFASNISLYGDLSYDAGGVRSKMFQLSTSNMVGFCDLATDFSFSAGHGGVSVGSFRSYFDFPDKNIRFSFGNVPVYSALEPSNPFGFSIEKNYAFGNGGRSGSRYEQQIVIDKDCTIIVFINGMETFRKSIKVGLYRLRDFAFVQGSNRIEIWQVPPGVEVVYDKPDSRIKISTFDMGYDNALLAKGESLWAFSYSFPSVEDKGIFPGFGWRDLQGRPMVAKFTDFSLSWERSLGVTDTFTLSNLAALSGRLSADGSYSLRLLDSFNLVKAFNWGTITAAGQLQFLNIPIGGAFDWDGSFKYRFNLSGRFNDKALAPLGLSLSFESARKRLALSASYGRGLAGLRGGISTMVGYSFDQKRLDWSVSASLSATIKKGPSVTLSLATSDKIVRQPMPVKVSIGVSIPIGKNGTANIRSDLSRIDAGIGLKPFGSKKSSVQISMGGFEPNDPLKHVSAVSLSYSGSLLGLSLRQRFSNSYRSFHTTASLNTALAFADGLFGMARSIPSSYLIVHPSGLIKRSSISMAKATASSSTPCRKVFGNVMYTDLSPHKHNSVVVFAGDGSVFGSGGTYLLGLTPRPRQGFVKSLEANPTATVTAVLRKADGEPYVMYSSPIYKVSETNADADGLPGLEIELTDDYMFTNEDGRFIQSNLAPGRYCIDLDVTGEGDSEKVWHGIFFDVPVLEDSSQVVVLEDHTVGAPAAEIIAAGDLYEKSYLLREVAREDERIFWDSLFAIDEQSFDGSEDSAPGAEASTEETSSDEGAFITEPAPEPESAPEPAPEPENASGAAPAAETGSAAEPEPEPAPEPENASGAAPAAETGSAPEPESENEPGFETGAEAGEERSGRPSSSQNDNPGAEKKAPEAIEGSAPHQDAPRALWIDGGSHRRPRSNGAPADWIEGAGAPLMVALD